MGYVRESTREQAKYGFNLDDQEKKIMKYVDVYNADGTYSMQMFREEGASAKSLDRPKMNELMSMVRRGQVDTIIIHNLDRLTRQVKDLAVLLEEFDKNNVSLVSITEKIDTKTPMGRFFIYMIVLIAQWEWETISSRSIRGIEESARQGNYALPGAPLGYRRNPEDNHKLIVNEDEADIVKRIFTSVAYKQYSLSRLAAEFNQENLLSKKWDIQRMSNILSNKIYYGTFSRFGVEYPNHTIPIITKDLYDKANQELKSHASRIRHKYLYKGLVVCKGCSEKMTCFVGKGMQGVKYLYYRCETCKVLLPEKKITEQYIATFDSLLQKSHVLMEISRCKELYDEISDVLEVIPHFLISNNVDPEYIAGQYCINDGDRKKLIRCIRMMRKEIQRHSFSELDYPEQRDFLIAHIETIEYDPNKFGLSIQLRSEDEISDKEL